MPTNDVASGGAVRVRFCPLGVPALSVNPDGTFVQTLGNPPCRPLPSGPPAMTIDGVPVSLETDPTEDGCRDCPLAGSVSVTQPGLP